MATTARLTKQAQATQRALVDGAIYHLAGNLVEARLKHTWVMHVLNDAGEYTHESYVLQGNGHWRIFPARERDPNEIDIGESDILYFADSRSDLGVDRQFEEIMHGILDTEESDMTTQSERQLEELQETARVAQEKLATLEAESEAIPAQQLAAADAGDPVRFAELQARMQDIGDEIYLAHVELARVNGLLFPALIAQQTNELPALRRQLAQLQAQIAPLQKQANELTQAITERTARADTLERRAKREANAAASAHDEWVRSKRSHMAAA